MSNAGSSDMIMTTYHSSNNHGRPSLQPLDSLRLMRENGSKRHRRNRNAGDLTQSGYNKSDLEIAVQASLAISEEQSSSQPLDSLRLMREKSPRRHHRNRGDLTQPGYNKSDLEIAVKASLAISEEQQYQQQGDEGIQKEDSGKRHNKGLKFTKSGYDEEELKRAIETSLTASSFKKGLDSVGVYEYIRTYPNQFRELFSRQEPLTAEKMFAIFTICHRYVCSEEEEDTFDEGESRADNDHDKMTKVEQKTAEFWKTYLRTVEAGGLQINLEGILMFTTGMKEQPYGQYPKIYFNHSYRDEPASKYPKSSTCSCILYLPLHENFEEFKEAMDFGILNGSQFGNA